MDTAEDNTAVETPPAAEVSAKPATATVTPDLSSLVRTLLSLCVLSGVYPVLSMSLCPVWCVPCCLSLCVLSGAYPAVSLCVSSLVHTLLSFCVQSGVYPTVSLCVLSGAYPAVSLCVSSLVHTLLSFCVQSGVYPTVSVCPVWCVPYCLSLSLCGWPLLYWISLLWLDLVCPKTHLLYFMSM